MKIALSAAPRTPPNTGRVCAAKREVFKSPGSILIGIDSITVAAGIALHTRHRVLKCDLTPTKNKYHPQNHVLISHEYR